MVEAYERAVLEWCTYIYLNHYSNGCLYVGSHTWKGRVGELDPDYLGSSVLAESFGWRPVHIELLEEVTKDRKFVAEREWILKYCKEFGVHPIVKYLHPEFGRKFNTGLVLNCHANSAEPALRPESRIKSYETRKARGLIEAWINSGCTKEARNKAFTTQVESGCFVRFLKSSQSLEVRAKRLITFKLSGAFDRFVEGSRRPEVLRRAQASREESGGFSRMIERAHSEESLKKRNFIESSKKASDTKRRLGIRPVRRKVEVIRDGVVVFTGSLGAACEYMGNRSWSNRIAPKLKTSNEVTSHGFLIREISHGRSI